MSHRGFSTWGIQTGPFAAYQADFVQIIFHLHVLYTWGLPFLITPERGRKGQGLEMEKMDSSNSELDTGVSDPGAFKLNH